MLELRTREDLQRLIDERLPESISLDYKATAALAKTNEKRKELTKDVSAFANSAGGQIVYGIVEQDQVPLSIDESLDRSEITPEWIEQVLTTSVSPRIEGLKIAMVPLNERNVAYVISIPQAVNRAPHQAIDKRYYRRHNFMSVPMEDHEIRDVFRRSSTPEPYLNFSIQGGVQDVVFKDDEKGRPNELSEPIEISSTIGNRSNAPAVWLVCRSLVSKFLTISQHKFDAISDGSVNDEPLSICLKKVGGMSHFPIFREASFAHERFSIRVPIEMAKEDRQFTLGYHIATPGYSGGFLGKLKLEGRKLTILETENPMPVTFE
ncbi:ATP-binding protein [Rhizobium sp. TH2]|uniref:AlbA family DNA-binding domain-containing protein n=1 Tax=Rhizobium sp. TH2 TaxID=2775403 RepID=UPI002157676F|nr:ATP-binding protein [Rhizobium sp. TH2]UVC07350.1 ATP-binding protein [Rhizobium sp. TH2]